MSRNEYLQLVELLIFYVDIPARGMYKTLQVLRSIPLTKPIRKQFESRLNELRNMAIADVQLQSGGKFQIKHKQLQTRPAPQKVEESKSADRL